MRNMWALKYRPRNIDEVLGQKEPLKLIKGALSEGDKPRTWLLQGPWGAGKTSTARILSKCFVCKNLSETFKSCGECEQCRMIDSESSPNYSEVDSASFGKADSIRELIEEAKLSPVDADYRVLALDEAHMLTKTAQSVLLKTLEEGVGNTIIMLITTDPDKLLPTILSRCVRVNLTPVDRKTVTTHLLNITKLENVKAEKEALELIVDHTFGHIRDALNLAQQVSLAGPITTEAVKKNLNLHLDESAASILMEMGKNTEEALNSAEALAQENSADEIWDAVLRVLLKAAISKHISTRNVPEWVREIGDLFSNRILNTSEWILSTGRKFRLRTAVDLEVSLLLVQERLGISKVELTKKVTNMGTPKGQRVREVSRREPLEKQDAVKTFFSLEEDVPDELGDDTTDELR